MTRVFEPPARNRILCVLPILPERTTGGGVLLLELLAHLVSRGQVAAVVPVAPGAEAHFRQLQADLALEGIHWHGLECRRTPGLKGYAERLLSPLPAEMTKFAVEGNWKLLERARRELRPTVELAVSSWALAAYRDARLPPAARLYMVNVDPAIIWHYGWSLKRLLAAAVDRPKVDRLCRRALALAGAIGAISAEDMPQLSRMGGRCDLRYVPPLMRPRPLDRSRAEPYSVLITTNFTYSQNVASLEWFLRECWPLVNTLARLTVAGKDEAGRLERLCKLTPRAIYAGCLGPAALDEAFARAAVAVNPTRLGSGFQIKLLDAIARGVPIVSTAFSNRIGPAIPSSDDPRQLATLIDSRLVPDCAPPFDYQAFYREAVAAWDEFLFDALPAPSA